MSQVPGRAQQPADTALPAASPTATHTPPAIVSGRYRVEERLGKGGVAAVYRVTELGTGRELALKRLENGANERLSALFELEYHTLAGLAHPNIVQAFEYGADSEGPYYTMELLTGADLRERAPLPWPVACRYVSDAAFALSALHARRLIHRDVSPRNLWCTADDRIKLIDFGALAPFGTSGEVVGTPPCVAPETLLGNALDQRADIYALGAVLYWLVTGAHAYPGRSLRELPTLWATPLVAASRRVAALKRADLPVIPAELDALIESTLSPEPVLRPRDIGDFLDRARQFAEQTSSEPAYRAASGLPQGAFVGRSEAKQRIRRTLDKALAGRGGALWIEGKRGEGRTRLLSEATIGARLAGATVLQVDGAACSGEYGVVAGLAQRLLDALPETARATARGLEPALARLSPAVEERLAQTPSAEQRNADVHAQLLGALTAWFSETSRQRPLVLAVDGLELSDDNSVWFLAGMAREAQGCPLLILTCYASDAARARTVAEAALERSARRIELNSLTSDEVIELVGSMFGRVPNLKRLAERAQGACAGNPARIVALLTVLLQRQAISYVDGTWVLHQQLDEEIAAWSAGGSVRGAAGGELSPQARALACQLSVRRGTISLELARALASMDAAGLASALSELLGASLLTDNDAGYRFMDEGLREAFAAELSAEARAAARVRLGSWLLSQGQLTLEEELEAHVHLLHGREIGAAVDGVMRVSTRLALEEQQRIGRNARQLEEALVLVRARGCDAYVTAPILACLTTGGYWSDRLLVTRHGDDALATFDLLLRLERQQRLQRWLGEKLSILVTLVSAAIRFRRRLRRGSGVGLRQACTLYFLCLTGLAAVHTICIDADAVLGAARRLQPWTRLRSGHVARTIHTFMLNLAATVQDLPGEARQRWRRMIEQLQHPSAESLPPTLRVRYLNGALYALGVLESWRDGPEALAIADRLEATGIDMYRLSADQVRATYHANQGNVALAQQYMGQIEQHAIRIGNAWQVEVWTPSAEITYALRAWDAMAVKQSLAQVERLATSISSLKPWVARTHGAHLVLRQRYADALPWLEQCLEERPKAAIGWGRSLGSLARALNGLGAHKRALQIVNETLAQLGPDDLSFPAMYLGLQIEGALAELGLGNAARAVEQLEALLARHAEGGVLTRGQLHEARMRAALVLDDFDTAERHFQLLSTLYAETKAPSLLARVDVLARQMRRTMQQDTDEASSGLRDLTGDTELSKIESTLAGSHSMSQLAERALTLLAQRVGANDGFLWLVDGDAVELSATLKPSSPRHDLDQWARSRIADCAELDVTQTLHQTEQSEQDPDIFQTEHTCFKLHVLSVPSSAGHTAVGAVALPVEGGAAFLDPRLTQEVAAYLGRARADVG